MPLNLRLSAKKIKLILMPKILKFFPSLLIVLIFLFLFPKIVLAAEEFCSLTINPDPIFSNEEFSVKAKTNSKSNKFEAGMKPYKLILYHSTSPQAFPLGEMKLITSEPNADDYNTGENDPSECLEWNHNDEGERTSCKLTADQTDPGDQKDSWNMEGAESYKFGIQGPTIIQLFDKNNKFLCSKNTNVEATKIITAQVQQPLKDGEKLVISGVVKDHLQPVKGIGVKVTINEVAAPPTSTDESGSYIINTQDTKFFKLLNTREYRAVAKTTINGEDITGFAPFRVGEEPDSPDIIKPPDIYSRITLDQYHNEASKDYWSTTSLQVNSPPTGYVVLGSQGDILRDGKEKDGLIPLYDCLEGEDHYNSVDFAKCNKNGKAAKIGFIYKTERENTQALYNCEADGVKDRKSSVNKDCKDKKDADTIYSNKGVIGYSIKTITDCTPDSFSRNLPVKGSTTQFLSLFSRLQFNSYPDDVKEDVFNDTRNSEPVCIGVRDEFIFSLPVIGTEIDFGSLVCDLASVFGIQSSFCIQELRIGEKEQTFFLGNLTNTVYNAVMAPEASRTPTHKDLHDIKQSTGDETLGTLGGQLGGCSGVLNVDMPCMYVEPDKPSFVTEGGEDFDPTPTGDIFSRLCLMFNSNLPDGIVPPGFPPCPELKTYDPSTPSASIP